MIRKHTDIIRKIAFILVIEIFICSQTGFALLLDTNQPNYNPPALNVNTDSNNSASNHNSGISYDNEPTFFLSNQDQEFIESNYWDIIDNVYEPIRQYQGGSEIGVLPDLGLLPVSKDEIDFNLSILYQIYYNNFLEYGTSDVPRFAYEMAPYAPDVNFVDNPQISNQTVSNIINEYNANSWETKIFRNADYSLDGGGNWNHGRYVFSNQNNEYLTIDKYPIITSDGIDSSLIVANYVKYNQSGAVSIMDTYLGTNSDSIISGLSLSASNALYKFHREKQIVDNQPAQLRSFALGYDMTLKDLTTGNELATMQVNKFDEDGDVIYKIVNNVKIASVNPLGEEVIEVVRSIDLLRNVKLDDFGRRKTVKKVTWNDVGILTDANFYKRLDEGELVIDFSKSLATLEGGIDNLYYFNEGQNSNWGISLSFNSEAIEHIILERSSESNVDINEDIISNQEKVIELFGKSSEFRVQIINNQTGQVDYVISVIDDEALVEDYSGIENNGSQLISDEGIINIYKTDNIEMVKNFVSDLMSNGLNNDINFTKKLDIYTRIEQLINRRDSENRPLERQEILTSFNNRGGISKVVDITKTLSYTEEGNIEHEKYFKTITTYNEDETMEDIETVDMNIKPEHDFSLSRYVGSRDIYGQINTRENNDLEIYMDNYLEGVGYNAYYYEKNKGETYGLLEFDVNEVGVRPIFEIRKEDGLYKYYRKNYSSYINEQKYPFLYSLLEKTGKLKELVLELYEKQSSGDNSGMVTIEVPSPLSEIFPLASEIDATGSSSLFSEIRSTWLSYRQLLENEIEMLGGSINVNNGLEINLPITDPDPDNNANEILEKNIEVESLDNGRIQKITEFSELGQELKTIFLVYPDRAAISYPDTENDIKEMLLRYYSREILGSSRILDDVKYELEYDGIGRLRMINKYGTEFGTALRATLYSVIPKYGENGVADRFNYEGISEENPLYLDYLLKGDIAGNITNIENIFKDDSENRIKIERNDVNSMGIMDVMNWDIPDRYSDISETQMSHVLNLSMDSLIFNLEDFINYIYIDLRNEGKVEELLGKDFGNLPLTMSWKELGILLEEKFSRQSEESNPKDGFWINNLDIQRSSEGGIVGVNWKISYNDDNIPLYSISYGLTADGNFSMVYTLGDIYHINFISDEERKLEIEYESYGTILDRFRMNLSNTFDDNILGINNSVALVGINLGQYINYKNYDTQYYPTQEAATSYRSNSGGSQAISLLDMFWGGIEKFKQYYVIYKLNQEWDNLAKDSVMSSDINNAWFNILKEELNSQKGNVLNSVMQGFSTVNEYLLNFVTDASSSDEAPFNINGGYFVDFVSSTERYANNGEGRNYINFVNYQTEQHFDHNFDRRDEFENWIDSVMDNIKGDEREENIKELLWTIYNENDPFIFYEFVRGNRLIEDFNEDEDFANRVYKELFNTLLDQKWSNVEVIKTDEGSNIEIKASINGQAVSVDKDSLPYLLYIRDFDYLEGSFRNVEILNIGEGFIEFSFERYNNYSTEWDKIERTRFEYNTNILKQYLKDYLWLVSPNSMGSGSFIKSDDNSSLTITGERNGATIKIEVPYDDYFKHLTLPGIGDDWEPKDGQLVPQIRSLPVTLGHIALFASLPIILAIDCGLITPGVPDGTIAFLANMIRSFPLAEFAIPQYAAISMATTIANLALGTIGAARGAAIFSGLWSAPMMLARLGSLSFEEWWGNLGTQFLVGFLYSFTFGMLFNPAILGVQGESLLGSFLGAPVKKLGLFLNKNMPNSSIGSWLFRRGDQLSRIGNYGNTITKMMMGPRGANMLNWRYSILNFGISEIAIEEAYLPDAMNTSFQENSMVKSSYPWMDNRHFMETLALSNLRCTETWGSLSELTNPLESHLGFILLPSLIKSIINNPNPFSIAGSH